MATYDLAPEMAFLVATWLEGLFYGLLVALFFQSLFVLLQRRKPDQPLNKLMLAAVVCMFLISTAHLSVNLHRLIQAFIFHRDSPLGPAGYLGVSSNPSNVAQVTLFGVQSLIGDMLNIYRCFVVWDRSWKITALPLILLALSSASGILVVFEYSQPDPANLPTLFDHHHSFWITLFYAVAPAQNILTTTLIAYRIWSIERKTSQIIHPPSPSSTSPSPYSTTVYGRFSLMPMLLIVVESAAVYSIAELVLIVLYVLDFNAQYLFLETITPIVGIVFTLIIIRVGQRSASSTPPPQPVLTTTNHLRKRSRSTHHSSPSSIFRNNSIRREKRASNDQLAIHISRSVVHDMDLESQAGESRVSVDTK